MRTATQNLRRAVELLAKPPAAQQRDLEDCGINAPYYSEELWLQFDVALDWVKRDICSDPRAAKAVAIVRPILDFLQVTRRPGFSDPDAIYHHGDWSILRELAGAVALRLERDDI